MKILNLYAGIGGNRKLWGDDHEIVVVENNTKIALIYQNFFPKDKIVITDAHQYLLEHFKEYDFIWSSPPCPTHSRIRKQTSVPRGQSKPIYPNMKLYEEILFLQGYFRGKYVVENVIGWYNPLISPQKIQRHYFWANFYINPIDLLSDDISSGGIDWWEKKFGFGLKGYRIDKRLVLRNCVEPELGLHIFKEAFREQNKLL